MKSTFFGTSFLAVAASLFGGACSAGPSTAESPREPSPQSAAELRLLGPEGLVLALARYDAAQGAEKEALELLVDSVAAQRYATVSRLFWHTDLASAKRASSDSGKPILSLRMLGHLDEDLSCANSRLFRVVLYANADVSRFLRDEFVLHWSSERKVPQVTIDYGDGRVIKTTIAGNSAHYVLDSEGRPIDVLPGLYGPQVFIDELTASAKLAAELADKSDRERAAVLTSFHEKKLGGVGVRLLRDANGIVLEKGKVVPIVLAEELTVTKAVIEMPVVRALSAGLALAKDARERDISHQLAALVEKPAKLDSRSRELLASLEPTDWSKRPTPLADLREMIEKLERQISLDTVLNQRGLRVPIHEAFASNQQGSFDELNEWIYSEVFLTPATDPWLGLATPGVFTGVPGDGHVQAKANDDFGAPKTNIARRQASFRTSR